MNNILACVAFYFNVERLKYLFETIRGLRDSGVGKIVIVTNAEGSAIEVVRDSLNDIEGFDVVTVSGLLHPFLLPMQHRAVFKNCFDSDESITHFLYSEDDHLFSKSNINYWFESFEELRSAGDNGIPCWFRIERRHAEGEWVSIDYAGEVELSASKLRRAGRSIFVDSPRPYAGSYMLDRALLQEFMEDSRYMWAPSPPSDSSYYAAREHAAFGMATVGLSAGSISRYRLRLNRYLNVVDPGAYIVHLPNNYANTDLWKFRKVSEFAFLSEAEKAQMII